ncbi:glycosyltransferase [Winogradskyella aurantia]|uniref:Glycosyl transferase family 1 n=1 Tax=Winogradskyella aurantia TaxID=1915063 RepID=A0A265UUM7_9FLAO|nr:glycosyltransferase [Winogradskyella aurantia]OZV69019.1 glycosyl transferase family 1 [Winogradskyella aurantia]
MKILLVGEYSRLHNSLKEGLLKLGHEVILLGANDGFKDYPVDLSIKKKYDKGFLKKFKNLLYLLFKFDLESQQIKRQILGLKPKISNYDIVQFINEASFGCTAKIEKEIFDCISSWNNNTYLLSCGSDYISINYAYQKKFRYSILTPYFKGHKTQLESSYGLKFLKPEFKSLHEFIFSKINGVIASDMDYHIPLKGHPKYLGLVPNPINTDQLIHQPLETNEKIIIFHGINETNYYKKGNDIFERALIAIQKKFSDNVEIITTRSIPYNIYIKAYDKAHIVLDMVYAYDQGYNALEAMSKGKVVFTGAEKEWRSFYGIEENTIAINALPDVDDIIQKLEWLIENPQKLKEISNNARKFIESHHNYIDSAKQYVDLWQNNSRKD